LSILKQVKSILKSKQVNQLIVEYESGRMETFSLNDGDRKAVKRLLDSVDWDEVAELQFVVNEDEDDDELDDEDDED